MNKQLKICKAMAELEGLKTYVQFDTCRINNPDGDDYYYNPITDKALCSDLTHKYEVVIDYWHNSVYMVDDKGTVSVYFKWENKDEIPELTMLAILKSEGVEV